MVEALQAMGSVVLDPYLIVLILMTTVMGVVIGVLPGLGATTGAALLLPFTLTMEPVHAIAVLATIYVSATFAGSITAILINTPGTAAAAATTFDGYPLAQRGEAGRALGIAVVSSTIGGVFSVIVLCIAAPMLARVAYEFRPPEYFALALFGLSMLASISAGGTVKNLIGGVFGVWLATIGAERATGIERFMFGNYELYEGLGFVPGFIGIFAISELLMQSEKVDQVIKTIKLKAVKLPSRDDYKRIWKTVLRSCGIGTFIGVLPAEGATIASMIGYAEARRWSKNKEEFGKGAIEGIAGAEAANNAVNGPTLVPLLTLGIPGDNLTVILVGAFIAQGLRPGPFLMEEQGPLVFAILVAMALANVLFLFIGYFCIPLFAKIVTIRKSFLLPLTLVFAFAGTWVFRGQPFDLAILVFFGAFGYIAKKLHFDVTPMAMGFILGPILEYSFGQTMVLSQGNLPYYMFVERPVTAVIFLGTPVITYLLWRRSMRLRREVADRLSNENSL